MINQGAGSARHPLQQLVHPNRCNERRRHHHYIHRTEGKDGNLEEKENVMETRTRKKQRCE